MWGITQRALDARTAPRRLSIIPLKWVVLVIGVLALCGLSWALGYRAGSADATRRQPATHAVGSR